MDISLERESLAGIQETLLYTGVPASSNPRIRFSGDPDLIYTFQLDVDGTGS